MPKKRQKRERTSIEDIYRNKHFVPPKEQNLETIFEEPRQSKDGVPILTSVKKYKRYLHFDPTQNKIQKRKRKAKKCSQKLKNNYRITRSSPENSKSDDISMYILDVLGDSSSDSDMDASNTIDKRKTFLNSEKSPTVETHHHASSAKDVSCSVSCDTPKRNFDSRKACQGKDLVMTDDTRSESPEGGDTTVNSTSFNESQKSSNNDEETVESPRRSCCVS